MALKTDDLYDKAVSLASDFDDNFLELAKTLRQLQGRDPERYKQAVAKGKVGHRKAYYLLNIAEWFGSVTVPKPRLRAIGWTKLMVIGPHVNEHNIEELLALAEALSTAQLKSHVKGVDPATNSHCVLMYFSPEQYGVFEQALVQAGASKAGRGLVDKETALINVLAKTVK